MTRKSRSRIGAFAPWLDVGAIAAWGLLMVNYWLSGKLNLLIHPNYIALVVAGGSGLLTIALFKGWILFTGKTPGNVQHFSIFPPGWSSLLLLVTALIGLQFTPRAFASDIAVQRGVADVAGLTRIQPQAFRAAVRPEKRTLIEWIRMLAVYPEPDAYQGQTVKVQGFVIHPQTLPPNYLMIARFIITCCAADVYPVGLPVKLIQNRSTYPPDTWIEIEGEMLTEKIEGKRQLTIQEKKITRIEQPVNPYDY
ncbi:MAG: TIGR03943 family putative permease subunit [Synechococcales cyanobacterium]